MRGRGNAAIGFHALIRADTTLRLEHLWVLPRAMHRGLGRALFQHAIARARTLGFLGVEIESDPNAEAFYLRMGAKRAGTSLSEVCGQKRELPFLTYFLSRTALSHSLETVLKVTFAISEQPIDPHADAASPWLMQTADNPWIELCPGIRRQTITSGQTMYQMLAHLDVGSRLPEHRHPQEQITYVIRGRVRMILSGVPRELGAGESLYIPSNIPHGAETIEETVVIDTFSPPRSEYLALDEQAKVAQSLSRTTRL